MKITSLLVTGLAASTLFLTSCGDKKGDDAKAGASAAPVSEKDALETFKKEAGEIEVLQKEAKASPDKGAGLHAMKSKVLPKILAVKTEGLPADLKTAVKDAQATMTKMNAALKDMPAKAEEVGAWMQSNEAVGMEVMKVMQEGRPSVTKLHEVAKKYGVEMED